ncbi:hypothetical protein SCP_1900860 [Sparassis crispa]|uniref:Uncharacterized protein n=1 Tax=Sparassis crispa TaxID=139825 RepID=A0A401H716_9APHY|nr:hypothetical protein SCP_1900860 [Sparassis crispa]GBE90237.1 hypothetical protein SCP_1900860 [Sparassis crispa]
MTLSRSRSSVSSIDIWYAFTVLGVPSIIAPSTEPSLLSTARSPPPVLVRNPCRHVDTPAAFAFTATSTERCLPETILSEAPRAVLTHDVNPLLQ